MRILSFVSFLLVGAAYGSPVAQPSCLTLETKDLCHFPFNYKGVIYDKCTYVETINNKPWCATVPEINITREGKVLFKSQFGDCDLESNCEVEVEVEDCSEDTCPCPRHYKPVCAEDGEVYDNLCLYECAKKKAACKNKREFPELVECNSSSQLGYISKFDSKQNDECQGKPCGEMCRLGVCDGHGFCVSPLESPCEQHGCHGKSCGDHCLLGDILGSCDIKGNCDSDTRKAIESCNQQGLRIQNRRVETISEADPKQISTNIPEMQPKPQVSSDDRRVSLGSFFECKFKKCGELCKTGVCDGDGFCVDPLESPCVQHGCGGKSCGEECLSGDIVGSCDIDGDCDFDSDRAINLCDTEVEDCSEDTLRGICSCPRHNKPVCAEDVYGHWQSVVYGNLCLYECAKKKAACKNKRGFPELKECIF